MGKVAEDSKVKVQSYKIIMKEILSNYDTLQEELDLRMERILRDTCLKEIKKLRIEDFPIKIGTRVWSSAHKRHGTVTSVKPHIDLQNNDYYADSCGPGRFRCPDTVSYTFTVTTDPSSVRKTVTVFDTSELFNEDGTVLYERRGMI